MNPNQYLTLTNWSDYPKINIHEFLARFDDLQKPLRQDGDALTQEAFINYHENFELILIEGNIHITEAQLDELKETNLTAIVVTGNLSVEGTVKKVFYVQGDIECDQIALDNSRAYNNFAAFPPKQHIHARQCAILQAKNDKTMRIAPCIKLQTPYVFSWYYELDNLEIAPETVIFIVGSWVYCQHMGLPNPILNLHDCVFASPYVKYVQNPSANKLPWLLVSISSALSKYESIFFEHFNPDSIKYKKSGDFLLTTEDYKNAYLAYKYATTLSPNYYPAWFGMGEALYAVDAFSQALSHFQHAATLFPKQQTNLINEALNLAALSAIRCQQYSLAIELATQSIAHNKSLKNSNYQKEQLTPAYCYRAQAYYLQNNLDLAIADLNIALSFNEENPEANWLMGLMYYSQNNIKQAQHYYRQATREDERFKVPYKQAKDTSFLAKTICVVNWENESSQHIELHHVELPKQDETFWLKYIAYHSQEAIAAVPKNLRSTQICLAALKRAKSSDQHLEFAKHFPQESITQEIAELLIKHDACNLQYIPKRLVTKELCLLAPKGGLGFQGQYIPKHFWNKSFAQHAFECGTSLDQIPHHVIDINMCIMAIQQDIENLEKIPPKLFNDECYMAAIAYGEVDDFSDLPSRNKQADFLKQTLKQYKCALDTIPGYAFTADVYAYAKSLYGNDDDWQAIEARHSLQFMLENKDEEASEICWSAFWDETFIIKHLSDKHNDFEPWQIPEVLFTPLVAEACFQRDKESFEDIPPQFITQAMSDVFNEEYPEELAQIPVKYRTQEICERSINTDGELIQLVPLALRTTALCIDAILEDIEALFEDRNLDAHIPKAVYLDVYQALIKKHADEFNMSWLLMRRGNGYLMQSPPNIAKALKDYHAVLAEFDVDDDSDVDNEQENDIDQAYYMIGYCHYLQGNFDEANVWLQKTAAPDCQIHYHKFEFKFPTEPQDFHQKLFDRIMHQVDDAVEKKSYQAAYDAINEAKNMLEKANATDIRLWSYVLDHQRFISFELELWQENLAICETIIQRFGELNLSPYDEDDNPCRFALRGAYYRLAIQGLERITTIKDVNSFETIRSLKHRLEMVEKIFKIKGEYEDEQVLYPFYEGQAWILLFIAYQFDESYHSKAYSSLQKILKLGLVEKGFISIQLVREAIQKNAKNRLSHKSGQRLSLNNIQLPEFRLSHITFSGIEFEVITPTTASQYIAQLTWGIGEHQIDVTPFFLDEDGYFLLARENATCKHFHIDYEGIPDDLVITGIIFAKDLTVEFGIMSQEIDVSPYFFVLGNCSARALALSGNAHVVMGNLTVGEFIYGKYNHGSLYVQGLTTTPTIIADDFEMHFNDLACNFVINENERITTLIPYKQEDTEAEEMLYANMEVFSTHTLDQIIADDHLTTLANTNDDFYDTLLVTAVSELSDTSQPLIDIAKATDCISKNLETVIRKMEKIFDHTYFSNETNLALHSPDEYCQFSFFKDDAGFYSINYWDAHLKTYFGFTLELQTSETENPLVIWTEQTLYQTIWNEELCTLALSLNIENFEYNRIHGSVLHLAIQGLAEFEKWQINNPS